MAAHDEDHRKTGPSKWVNTYASIPTMQRGKPVLIGGDPKGEKIIYCTGNSVVMRSVKEPLLADTYSEHQKNPTVARFSPSGYYVASADEMGVVRIWDTVQSTHPLKLEIRALSGRVYDLAWTEDSKRIVAVGDGREKFGAAFFADSGASVGEISGHSKTITTVDVKQTRPFRVMTGGEDNACCWFEGPPFKWKKTLKHHQRFVNCVRFSPDGSLVASAAQDKNVFVFDGKTGEPVGQFDEEHKGGIYAASWSGDGKQLLTASADRTCKIWDVETRKSVTTFQFDSAVEFQQLGCLWQNEFLLSIGLNGYLNYLDPASGKVQKTAHGHQNFVTAIEHDEASDSFFSASFDSIQVRWAIKDASTSLFEGAGHSNQISQLCIDGDQIYSAAMDDSFGVSSTAEGASGRRIATDSPALGISAAAGVAVGISMKSVSLIRGDSVVQKTEVSWKPTAVAVSADGKLAAVGADDKKVRVYRIEGDALVEDQVLDKHTREITAVTFSPDGTLLATACTNRSILLWKTGDWSRQVDGQWCFHGSKINRLSFSPDSQLLASAGLDQDVFIWCPTKKMRRLRIDLVHRGGVNDVKFISNTRIVTAGQDCALKTFDIDRSHFGL